jgi:hypothetical protein
MKVKRRITNKRWATHVLRLSIKNQIHTPWGLGAQQAPKHNQKTQLERQQQMR